MPVAPIAASEFAARLDQLGPFEPKPVLGVAVSGGADSLATALLARNWARARGGAVRALLVDHRLRAESAEEIRLTVGRLAELGIESRVLVLQDLPHGPGLPARARAARHAALELACAETGILHLLFGHHAGDQAETICMRMLAGSLASGLAGMAALVERPLVRLLRPLLDVPPARLRATLRAQGIDWVEDPSNHSAVYQRARLRGLRGDPEGTGLATRALLEACAARGEVRLAEERADAGSLARGVTLWPLGHALWHGALSAGALAALIGLISGRDRPPSPNRLQDLAAQPRPATIGGVRILRAGRLGPGLLLVREAAAMQAAIPAVADAVWDGRFRVARSLPGHCIGAWGEDVPRDRGDLPVAVRRVQPVLRHEGRVILAGDALLAGSQPFVESFPLLSLTGGGFCRLP